jgi:broad specificity phosphatase PhoE
MSADVHAAADVKSQPKWHRRQNSGVTDGTSESELGTFHCPTSHEGPGYEVEVPTVSTRKYAVIMVGLPARGKTFLAQKISRYLAWLGHESAVFNVQRMWREYLGIQNPHRPLNSNPSTVEFGGASPDPGMASPNPSSVLSATADSPQPRSPMPGTEDCRTKQYIDADLFFQAFTNTAEDSGGQRAYESAIDHCVTKVRSFFGKGGLVAFINDDFVTRRSRDYVESRLLDVADQVLYIEVERDDQSNARFERLKVSSSHEYGDQAGSCEAQNDFAKRVALLKSVYEHVKDDKSFIRVRNGDHIYLHNVRGYLPSRMTSFLMHLSPQNKVFCPIYFSRHGQSEYNLEDRLGGNPRLTEKGRDDAIALKNFIATIKAEHDETMRRQNEEVAKCAPLPDVSISQTVGSIGASMSTSAESLTNLAATQHATMKPIQIWTSQLTRTIETAKPAEVDLGLQCLRWRNLNEIHAGVCEHLTYAEVRTRFPLIHDFRKKNKYAFRYPDGESYQDLVTRLEPVIMELENADRVVVVVAHQAVLRALLAYFGGSNAEHSVHVEVPHRTVWRCSFDDQGIPMIDEMKLPPNTTSDQVPIAFVPTGESESASPVAAHTPKAP